MPSLCKNGHFPVYCVLGCQIRRGLYTVTADIRVMKSYRNWELKKVMR